MEHRQSAIDHCEVKLVYKAGNMSSMKRHLQGKHSIVEPAMPVKRDHTCNDESDDVDGVNPPLKKSSAMPYGTPLRSFLGV